MNNLIETIRRMKEQGISPKRALFNLKIQHGRITPDLLDLVKTEYGLSEAEVKYLLGWFPQLKDKAVGKHTLIVCGSCHKGDETYLRSLSEKLQTPINGISKDGLFSLEVTGCMGLCALGPNAILDQQIYNAITTNTVFKNRIEAILKERTPNGHA